MNRVTKKLIEQLKVGDSVEFYFGWRRAKITEYEIDPPKDNMKPAANFKVEIDGETIDGVLIEGDEAVLRSRIPAEQRQRYTVRRVKT
jgi:hypothetical protein